VLAALELASTCPSQLIDDKERPENIEEEAEGIQVFDAQWHLAAYFRKLQLIQLCM
jgi:hypothetical protein